MKVIVEQGATVAMRDGTELRCDVYRPATRHRLPVLVQRTPYDKSARANVNVPLDCIRAAADGYCVVVQDVRGRYSSGGRFTPFKQELDDGSDTLGWAATQSWSNGHVGMFGTSYAGATQWLAAGSGAKLDAVAPFLTPADWYEGWSWDGDAFRLGFVLLWTLRSLAWGEALKRVSGRDRLASAIDRVPELYLGLDRESEGLLDDLAPYYKEWRRPGQGPELAAFSPRHLSGCSSVPALNVGGWFDIFLSGTIENYHRARKVGTPSKLVVGPWAHGNYSGTYPERNFGHRSSPDWLDMAGMHLRWFDRWLSGQANDAMPTRARIFVMGPNVWRDEEDWPPPNASTEELFLRAGGRLSPTAPGSDEPTSYEHQWRDPVPTIGGSTYLPGLLVSANSGPRDVSSLLKRHDLIFYQTEVLSRSLELAGPVELRLHAASTVRKMQFTATLVDIASTGRSETLMSGINTTLGGSEDPTPLVISLGHTAYAFDRGHRVGLIVASSSFPMWAQVDNLGQDSARNTIFHDASRRSVLSISVRQSTEN